MAGNYKRELGGLGASAAGGSVVYTGRLVNTTAPLYGGGSLENDLTIYLDTAQLLAGVPMKNADNAWTGKNSFTDVHRITAPAISADYQVSGMLQCYRFIHVINYDEQTPEVRTQQVMNAGAIGTAPLYITYRARGVVSQPSGLRIGDYQGVFATAAYRESSGGYNASMALAGVQVDTDYGARLSVQTVASGAGVLVERLQVGEQIVSKSPVFAGTLDGQNRYVTSGDLAAGISTVGMQNTDNVFWTGTHVFSAASNVTISGGLSITGGSRGSKIQVTTSETTVTLSGHPRVYVANLLSGPIIGLSTVNLTTISGGPGFKGVNVGVSGHPAYSTLFGERISPAAGAATAYANWNLGTAPVFGAPGNGNLMFTPSGATNFGGGQVNVVTYSLSMTAPS